MNGIVKPRRRCRRRHVYYTRAPTYPPRDPTISSVAASSPDPLKYSVRVDTVTFIVLSGERCVCGVFKRTPHD